MESGQNRDGSRQHKLLLTVAFITMIFGAVIIWPNASAELSSTGVGSQIDNFLSSQRSDSPEDQDSVVTAGEDTAEDAPGLTASAASSNSDADTEDADLSGPLSTPDVPTTRNELSPSSLPFNDDQTLEPTGAVSPSSSTSTPRSSPSTTTASTTPQRQTTSTTLSPGRATVPPTIVTTSIAPGTTTIAPPTTTTTIVFNPPSTTPQPIDGRLYVNPFNVAANWLVANPLHPDARFIAEEIAAVPTAVWFGDWNPNVETDVRNYVAQADAFDRVPVLVAYNIPNRDCGQFSAGGAASHSAYASWIGDFADGLGDGEAIIILEPDSLALTSCLDNARKSSLSNAVTLITDSCDACMVYLDAGHSNWIAPAEMASRLTDAGVYNAAGFFTNVSNYISTANETEFGVDVLAALGNPAGMGQVIDTSRNGNGSSGPADWCDQQGSALGAQPALNPSPSTVHAYLWVKVPGEADGCVAPAGVFVPAEAIRLATN